MSFALNHIFSPGEQRTRGRHERIDVTLNDPHDNDDVDLEQGTSGTSSRVNPANANASNARTSTADDTFPNEEELEDNPDIESDIMEEGEGEAATNEENINPDLQRRMAELEEEREIRRRRQSTCTIFVMFILFRLWVEALAEGDVGLLFICMMGTSWTAKWVRAQREQEEELDRRMEEYFRRGGVPTAGGEGGRGFSAEADLSLMSFQAQLALAILESQRQMMENGGFGNSDAGNQRSRGVSEEARNRWFSYDYSAPEEMTPSGKVRKDGYGSVSDQHPLGGDVEEESSAAEPSSSSSSSNTTSHSSSSLSINESSLDGKKLLDTKEEEDVDDYEMPACSICLCEYEEGENLSKLPCGHVYHTDCVTAWVDNHTRCPLCNFDLMEEVEEGGATTPSSNSDSIV